MTTWADSVVGDLRSVGLTELLETASLQDRVDRKYLVEQETAARLVAALRADHRVLQLGGARVQGYSTVYLDSADLACHRAHLQGRRRRWKARTRQYLGSDLTRLEVKTKGLRGRTVKVSQELDRSRHGEVDDAVHAFVDAQLQAAYGRRLDLELVPVLEVVYRRTTLVSDDGSTRLTLDTDLAVRTVDGRPVGGLRPDAVLVETKAGGRPGTADRALRGLGVHEASCSKYCLGTAMAAPSLPSAPFRPLLRRWFVPADAASLAA